MNKQSLFLATLLLLCAPGLVTSEVLKCTANDWTQVARAAQDGNAPILVLYTSDECPYCDKLKEEVLQPMFRNDPNSHLAVVREVDINKGGKMTDFDGERIRSRHFKKRYKVFAAPTLLILDASGTPLSKPFVGYNSKEQYVPMLESALEKSRILLKKPSSLTEDLRLGTSPGQVSHIITASVL